MELEPLEEVTPTESTPVEVTPVGAKPLEDARAEGRYYDASPTEEESEEAMPDAFERATPMEEDSAYGRGLHE